ncbi:MAG: hypothetical protein QOG07_304 [Pseudonocardiales bacterium]|nr:hypothetical protein [Pseudonocardiales bacterium]
MTSNRVAFGRAAASDGRGMRLLILGAGGVGSAAALIAARHSFRTHVIVVDSTSLALSVR